MSYTLDKGYVLLYGNFDNFLQELEQSKVKTTRFFIGAKQKLSTNDKIVFVAKNCCGFAPFLKTKLHLSIHVVIQVDFWEVTPIH